MALTDEQIVKTRKAQQGRYGSSGTAPYADSIQFARAIESAATAPLLERIAELERELAEARKDAERYRWLRDLDEDPVLSLAAQYTDMNGSATSIAQRIDEAIDATMKDTP